MLLAISVHLSIDILVTNHLLSIVFVFFITIHVLHFLWVALHSFDLTELLLVEILWHFAIFLLVYQHVLFVCLHLQYQLLVLLLIKLIHVLFAVSVKLFTIVVHVIFFLCYSLCTLLSLGCHQLLDLVIGLVDIFVISVVAEFIFTTSRRVSFLLLLKHVLLHLQLFLLIFIFFFAIHLIVFVIHAVLIHELLITLAIDAHLLVAAVLLVVIFFSIVFLVFTIIHFYVGM